MFGSLCFDVAHFNDVHVFSKFVCAALFVSVPTFSCLSLCALQRPCVSTMNKIKNFKRRFSLSVPRTETIEENEFMEQINHLNIKHTQGNFFPTYYV